MDLSLGNLPVLTAIIVVFGFFVIFLIAAKLYRRTTKEMAFVKTGLGGEKVILDGGAFVLPIFHEIVPVNMRTLRLQVDRKHEEGLITADRMRVDVTAEFYVRVKPVKESIAKAAQTLGNRTLEPETLKELLQGKFVDALRSVAAGLSMEQLHERRAEFVQSVQASVSEDLLKNGLELESVSLTALDQTARQFFKEDNAFDAQGLAKLTSITELKRDERNRIEQDTRISIEQKNLEAAKRSLEIKRDEDLAAFSQRREVETAKAEQDALVSQTQAQRKREAEAARSIEEQKEKEAAIAAEQAVRERDIAREQAVKEREITARRQVEEADINREKTVSISKQVADIEVAKKSEEKSKAEASAAIAFAEKVKQEEQVETVRTTAVANRTKEVRLIKAQEDAQQDAIGITVAAEAERKAAQDRAEAALTEARANADRIRIIAEADQKRLEVEAIGERAINEAKNLLAGHIIDFEIRKIVAQVAPQIMEAAVKPMEKIESIKIIQANGFGGVGGAVGGKDGGGTNGGGGLPHQLVEAALGYRMNLPLVEKLLKEIGLRPDSPEGLVEALGQMTGTGGEGAADDEKPAASKAAAETSPPVSQPKPPRQRS
ncbi:MAG: flotillin family protein [Puniceicoccaceae bacterium]|nr:MAG: flotillin family protein [Puniceicoccaceae bacterium]